MQALYFLIYVVALVLFAIAFTSRVTKYNLLAGGLFCLTLVLVIQLAMKLT